MINEDMLTCCLECGGSLLHSFYRPFCNCSVLLRVRGAKRLQPLSQARVSPEVVCLAGETCQS